MQVREPERRGVAIEERSMLSTAEQDVLTAGDFQCASCGYGISVKRSLPRCPMCGGDSWERSTRGPLQ